MVAELKVKVRSRHSRPTFFSSRPHDNLCSLRMCASRECAWLAAAGCRSRVGVDGISEGDRSLGPIGMMKQQESKFTSVCYLLVAAQMLPRR